MNSYHILLISLLTYSCNSNTNAKELEIGIRQYRNDSLAASIKTLSKVIKKSDTCKDCLLYRGFAYKELEEYSKALEDFNKLIKLDTNSPIGYANRASVFYMKNNYEKALLDFYKAYQIDSSSILLNPICHMLYATGFKDSACLYYQKLSKNGDTTFDKEIVEYCNKKNIPKKYF